MSMTGSRTPSSAQSVRAAERQAKALELRRQGKSYQEIATVLKVTPTTVSTYVRQALEELRRSTEETTKEVFAIEAQRLDYITEKAFEAVEAGEKGAIDTFIRVLKRRAEMFGIDAPKRAEINLTDGDQRWAMLSLMKPEYQDRLESLSDQLNVIADGKVH